nr:unnamed protein product [Digitaria exilis]
MARPHWSRSQATAHARVLPVLYAPILTTSRVPTEPQYLIMDARVAEVNILFSSLHQQAKSPKSTSEEERDAHQPVTNPPRAGPNPCDFPTIWPQIHQLRALPLRTPTLQTRTGSRQQLTSTLTSQSTLPRPPRGAPRRSHSRPRPRRRGREPPPHRANQRESVPLCPRPPSRPRRAAWGHARAAPPGVVAQPPRRASLVGRPLERIEAGRAAPEWLGFGGAAELAPPNAQRREAKAQTRGGEGFFTAAAICTWEAKLGERACGCGVFTAACHWGPAVRFGAGTRTEPARLDSYRCGESATVGSRETPLVYERVLGLGVFSSTLNRTHGTFGSTTSDNATPRARHSFVIRHRYQAPWPIAATRLHSPPPPRRPERARTRREPPDDDGRMIGFGCIHHRTEPSERDTAPATTPPALPPHRWSNPPLPNVAGPGRCPAPPRTRRAGGSADAVRAPERASISNQAAAAGSRAWRAVKKRQGDLVIRCCAHVAH